MPGSGNADYPHHHRHFCSSSRSALVSGNGDYPHHLRHFCSYYSSNNRSSNSLSHFSSSSSALISSAVGSDGGVVHDANEVVGSSLGAEGLGSLRRTVREGGEGEGEGLGNRGERMQCRENAGGGARDRAPLRCAVRVGGRMYTGW